MRDAACRPHDEADGHTANFSESGKDALVHIGSGGGGIKEDIAFIGADEENAGAVDFKRHPKAVYMINEQFKFFHAGSLRFFFQYSTFP